MRTDMTEPWDIAINREAAIIDETIRELRERVWNLEAAVARLKEERKNENKVS